MNLFLQRVLNRMWPRSIAAAASRTRIISPGVVQPTKPAFALPGEFDAVIDVVNGDRQREWKRIIGADLSHLPTIEYVLDSAKLSGIYLSSGRHLARFPTSRPCQPREGSETVCLEKAVLSTNVLSGLEFGHWVRDSLVTEIHGLKQSMPAVALAREAWPHEPGFRHLTGLICDYPQICRVAHLTVLDDRGHNAYWQDRFRLLRERTRALHTGLSSERAEQMIFLSRGPHARAREPGNIIEVQAALEAVGFQTLVPADLSPSEIQGRLRHAKVIVSAEGSNLNHVHFFAPDGVALITLQDPRRFYSYHSELVALYGGRFGFIVGRMDPQSPDRHNIGISDLFRTIDLAS